MRYKTLDGFAAIRGDEPENALAAIQKEYDEKLANGAVVFAVAGAKEKEVSCTPEMTVAELVEKAGGPADGSAAKFVHIGLPLGKLVPAAAFDRKVLEFAAPAQTGSFELAVFGENDCAVDYMGKLTAELKEESCGRCVLCRMALQQLGWLFDDAVNGRGRSDDKKTILDVAEAMQLGAHCPFGKAAGALAANFAEDFGTVLEEHTKKKICSAGVCKKYMTVHILPSKCTGCGDCMDVCDEDAITGKSGYIHMIDELDCTNCGKCIEACEEEAIIVAGARKPKSPDKLTKVGRWKGKDY